jgi:hypothetical protein
MTQIHKLNPQFHQSQGNLHREHSKSATTKGDHSLASKHGKMAHMHDLYYTANALGFSSKGTGTGRAEAHKNSQEYHKLAGKLHAELSKCENDLNKSELDDKSLKDIQKETAEKWAGRAEEAYKKAIDEKSVKWLLDAIEYGHEAIEHSSLGEDLAVFEKIRAKLMPMHEEALKLFVSEE